MKSFPPMALAILLCFLQLAVSANKLNVDQLCHSVVQNTSLSPRTDNVSKAILEKFTSEELECLAQSSYTYWYATSRGEVTDREEMRRGMALREISRYYDAAREDENLTFSALKTTCDFRQVYRIDILRSCFDETFEFANEEDEQLAREYRTLISEELSLQPMIVKSGSAGKGVLSIGRRSSPTRDDEGYILSVIFMIERAIAVTESLSRGSETQIDVIIDADGVKSRFSPSRKVLKRLIYILQNQYPQRLGTFVVLDPPLWLSTLWSVISVFVDQRTRNKFQLARGDDAKDLILSQFMRFPSETERDPIESILSAPFDAVSDENKLCPNPQE